MTSVKQHHDNSAPALARCKSFTFDVNQQAESLIKWEQRYNQHSGGLFNGYLDEVQIGGLHFFEEFTSHSLQQQCCINGNNLWFGFSLQSQRPKINNNELLAGQLMRRASGVEFELLTPDDFHIYGLVVDKDNLSDEMIGQDAEQWQSHNNNIQLSEPNHYLSYELAKLISLLLNTNNTQGTQSRLLQQNNKTRLNTLMPLINSKVADLLIKIEYGGNLTYQSKQRVISAIKNHIRQTEHYPLTITELCKIANVSRRTLQYCFEQGMGLSPIQYIRDCRLNEIRRILLKEEQEISITSLAMNFGFFHLATFNLQYKQLFAETPTQTLLRAVNYQHANIKLLRTNP